MYMLSILVLLSFGVLLSESNSHVQSSGQSSPASADVRDARELLQRFKERFQRHSTGVKYQIDTEFSLTPDPHGHPAHEPLVRHKRTILELGKSGVMRELVWGSKDDGELQDFTALELLYDGKRQLMVFREATPPDEAGELVADEVLNLVYYGAPTLSESHGMRADGLLLMLGRIGHYSPNEISIMQLALDGQLNGDLTNEGTYKIESDAEVGKIVMEFDREGNRLLSLSCVADQPTHMYHSVRLATSSMQMVSQSFRDFQYQSIPGEHEEMIAGFSFETRREPISGEPFRFHGRVTVTRLPDPPLETLDFEQPIPFHTPVPDGTPVDVIGNPMIKYEIIDGRLKLVVDRRIGDQISAKVSEFKETAQRSSQTKCLASESAIDATEDGTWADEGTSGLCGVISLYAVACYWNAATTMESWISPEYVSSANGSRLDELVEAATAHQFQTVILNGLTVEDVSRLDVPAILHVRSRAEPVAFDHWVVSFGRDESGSVTILDPTYGIETVSKAELAARFGGTVLLMSPSQSRLASNIQKIRYETFAKASIYGFLFLSLAALVKYYHGRWQRWFWLVMLSSVVLLAVQYHRGYSGGLLNEAPSRMKLVAAFEQTAIPKIGLQDLTALIADSTQDVILVDSRFQHQFDQGTIADAFNFSLDLSSQQQLALVKSLDRNSPIVVFCQSAECSWSETIARRLLTFGFRNVLIYSGGYNEWRKHEMGR